jgi:multiple sugar transport system permease protein
MFMRSRLASNKRKSWQQNDQNVAAWERGSTFSLLARYSVLIVLALLFLVPFYLLLRSAFLTQAQLFTRQWMWFPQSLMLQSLQDVFQQDVVSMTDALRNSLVIAVLTVAGQMLFASMGGYALARIPYRWRNLVFYAVLLTLMIPGAVTFVPTFIVVSNLGWVNTLQGIVVPGLFNGFYAILFRQFYLDFPKDLEDAARIDGVGYWGIYWRIVLPNALTIHIALGLLSFIGAWNSFLWPLVIGQDSSLWTVQIAIASFIQEQVINYPALFMATLISVVPVMLIFFFAQRYLVAGITRTGIRG